MSALRRIIALAFFILASGFLSAGPATKTVSPGRERLLMDFGWRFAFGHATDAARDFNYGTGYFSYLAKTGFGDGPAAAEFDDHGWRSLDLPHDWAVEVPFDEHAGASHGFKTVGKQFPATSVGWYRKAFFIPSTDLGRRISIEFDGVFRDAQVWINGHFLGREDSGYTSFAWNLTEFLHYGGNNVIVVRVDASMEEGWFYEGAGIYRHVWLLKTDPLHIDRNGTFITSDLKSNSADVKSRVTIVNEAGSSAQFEVENALINAAGEAVAPAEIRQLSLNADESCELTFTAAVAHPKLWSIESPNLHRVRTEIRENGVVVDSYETSFGIRSIQFDADRGFFLNGTHVVLKGVNNHQDHAGVGAAIPDALQDYRIARLKEFGCNAYRCAHNPPSPELLDACDRMGMLVIDENRLMGTSDYHLEHLKRLVRRDRNHPSVILWSLGNEEWAIEGNDQGERITDTMQRVVKQLDPTRQTMVASSGGWGKGSSRVAEIMGFNYISHGNTDEHHAKFPSQPGVGAEECSFNQTRGVYVDDRSNAHLRAYDWDPSEWGSSAEQGWTYYAERPYLAGMFVWTGFDYRGEPTPFGWPAISSQFGVLDTCGFSKDVAYYFKSWWSDEPVLHVFPHWNWPGREGSEISVWAYSNCDEVELWLNGASLGRKSMKKNSHLEWQVKYTPGTLLARGFRAGREILTSKVETTGESASIQLAPHRAAIRANARDISVITVQALDAQGRSVPTANNEVSFELSGPGRILGVGNGDPSCHEADRLTDTVAAVPLSNWRRKNLDAAENAREVAFDFDDSSWSSASTAGRGSLDSPRGATSRFEVYRATFEGTDQLSKGKLSLWLRSVGSDQSFYVNGQLLARHVRQDQTGHQFELEPSMVRAGKNVIAIVATPVQSTSPANDAASNGASGKLLLVNSPRQWKRSLFNGLAQVIVESTSQPGTIVVTAKSKGLIDGVARIETQSSPPGPAVASNLKTEESANAAQ